MRVRRGSAPAEGEGARGSARSSFGVLGLRRRTATTAARYGGLEEEGARWWKQQWRPGGGGVFVGALGRFWGGGRSVRGCGKGTGARASGQATAAVTSAGGRRPGKKKKGKGKRGAVPMPLWARTRAGERERGSARSAPWRHVRRRRGRVGPAAVAGRNGGAGGRPPGERERRAGLSLSHGCVRRTCARARRGGRADRAGNSAAQWKRGAGRAGGPGEEG